MLRFATALALLGSCCAAARAGGPVYAAGDPLGVRRAPITVYDARRSTAPLLRAVLAEGYRQSSGEMGAPVLAVFSKTLRVGEAAILVERYSAADGSAADKELFLRNLAPAGETPRETRHKVGALEFPVRHGLEFVRFTRRIGSGDPYSDYLGAHFPPPRLSLFERRRFLVGGEAYRLYRCRRLDAWGMLGDYRRMRRKKRLGEHQRVSLRSTERKIIAACFGREVIMAVGRGDEVPRIPKPSMYRLRIMAREERAHGAVRSVEHECVHLRAIEDGFLVLRFRAPAASFKREHAAFETFLGSLVYYGFDKP
ncbi:MAG: hypothetical protein ABIJ96_04635 [Elusimicrobiota bacterium]